MNSVLRVCICTESQWEVLPALPVVGGMRCARQDSLSSWGRADGTDLDTVQKFSQPYFGARLKETLHSLPSKRSQSRLIGPS
jgi:hypothetical protein